jgi:hypothetical protein
MKGRIEMNMLREQALPYVSWCLDDAQSISKIGISMTADQIPANAVLVGWQCGFEPMFVAVKSYLPNTTLDQDEAVEIAVDYLLEVGWFAEHGKEGDPQDKEYAIEPDYIIGGRKFY